MNLRTISPAILLAFALAGCHGNQNQATNAAESQPAQDPATANLANANYTTTAEQNPPPPPADQSAAPPSDQGSQYPSGYGDESAGYDDSAYDVASEPPPSIPDYEQPPSPGDDYEWTPGYWSYAADGYYWVPGAWVLAPYVGALWTPGYWGWDSGRYHWHGGYWGPHVGFYGGVNYGYGYDGDGYEGGYWQGRDFYYNRAITRVNPSTAHHVYEYRVSRGNNNSRVSYNGGNGGLNYRPTQAQQAARNERHIAPLAAQHSFAQQAMQNRGQFAKENHGRPQTVAQSQPVNDGRSAPAARAEDFHPSPSPRTAGGHAPMRTGPATPPVAGRGEPNRGNERGATTGSRAPLNEPRPMPGAGIRPQPGRLPESQPAPQPSNRPEGRRQPESRSRPQSKPSPSRPAPQPRTESRQAPNPHQAQPENRQEQRAPVQQPRPQPEVRQPQQRPESRPTPEQRPESRPAPQSQEHPQQPHQESRPAPQPRQEQHPENKPGEKRPQ